MPIAGEVGALPPVLMVSVPGVMIEAPPACAHISSAQEVILSRFSNEYRLLDAVLLPELALG
jgi:hypothetical protein